ncbi:ArsR/SmtB family transcription factor [Treponema brennaborense]|uniref:Regulatory protein ArsR n=1 Tax=Treponema brennaborense (strain DSM 12168 / CIP 105900 / DD5/3) TaxID=906968 RepID=F4LKE5_TREBD|nr:metalloregulator ArsR/SmtB family transcription factor [Treponema brennaborense]AEE16519.1 regulatory protein ArsR [Treponema brennaborense DSM 12168]
MLDTNQLQHIKELFIGCQSFFVSLGDEIRQEILLHLIDAGLQGLNVGEIKSKMKLSRPAISHHLKILKQSGIITIRREGTSNYYYISIITRFAQLKELMLSIEEILNDPDVDRELAQISAKN